MNDLGKNFMLAVNCEKEEAIKILSKNLNDFMHVFGEDCKFKDIIIDILVNDDFDSHLAETHEDGFLFFKYNLEFYPLADAGTVQDQIILSEKLRNVFRNEGIPCEIIAEFEHLLEE